MPVEDKPTGIEREIYRSCLKKVVKHLNTTLPPLSDSEESEPSKPTKKSRVGTKRDKKESKPHGKSSKDGNSYLLRDVKPTLDKEKSVKKASPAKGRRNTRK